MKHSLILIAAIVLFSCNSAKSQKISRNKYKNVDSVLQYDNGCIVIYLGKRDTIYFPQSGRIEHAHFVEINSGQKIKRRLGPQPAPIPDTIPRIWRTGTPPKQVQKYRYFFVGFIGNLKSGGTHYSGVDIECKIFPNMQLIKEYLLKKYNLSEITIMSISEYSASERKEFWRNTDINISPNN